MDALPVLLFEAEHTQVERPVVRLGIDVGSTTAKVVFVDPGGRTILTGYRRHNAEILGTLTALLREAVATLGERSIEVLVTGSAGMGIAEKYELPFIQEVVASAEVIRQRYPQVQTLIDVGGEDAKIIFFDPHRPPDMRMNGSCAGGTGAFIDEMATLLGISVSDLDRIASLHTSIHPMASRCGVFAKTDLQNLLSRQVPREDIAASVFHAVTLQILATLARGREIRPPLLFSGGPFTFLPALKKAFLEAVNLSEAEVIHAESPELLPAMGAALAPGLNRRLDTLQGLLDRFAEEKINLRSQAHRLPALFGSSEKRLDWGEQQKNHRISKVEISECQDEEYFLGIDSGSTTTKVVLIDVSGRVAFSYYANNGGNSIQAARAGLGKLREAFAGMGFLPRIARSMVTGYGEDLIRAAFGMDAGIVETFAHFRAAQAFDPEVTFILDIGGQDMKAIFLKDGQIQNIEINEACSSGCGSFIETFARNMGYSVANFAELACASEGPYNLGTRCTVFMNSRVKQALREGTSIDDISAGLAYSVIKNALYKVLKITDPALLGEHIIVQGGAFRNPAVQRALETLIGRSVVCPDLAELMGAYGAALSARDQYLGGEKGASVFAGLDNLTEPGQYQRREIHCKGCGNTCAVTKLGFSNGNSFFSGQRCERIFSNNVKKARKGTSVPALKLSLLFEREVLPKQAGRLTIGIPRVLNMFENYPFWHTLFTECGIRVQLSAPSSSALYQGGAAHIMSENLCFPGKLVSGHILDLVNSGVDRIFYPMAFYEMKEFVDDVNSFNCPVVSGFPDVVRSAVDPERSFSIPLDTPVVTFRERDLLKKACTQYLAGLGIKPRLIEAAFIKAQAAQAEYKQRVITLGAELLAKANAGGHPVILLMGRPYHIDPLINHGIAGILTDFGVDVLTEDCIPAQGEALDNAHVIPQWEYLNRYLHAARWVGRQENIELVQLNSFGCGPDAFILEEIRLLLAEYGKFPTVIRIDEIESAGSVKLRLRSMLEAYRQPENKPSRRSIARRTTKPFTDEDRIRTVLVPDFSPFCSPPIVRPFMDLGYQIVSLPPADHNSVEVGLKYTNNEICYPGIITLGDLVKALQSGKYDLSRTAVGFSQTGGQCRATSIPSMIKKALVAAGFEQVPVVTLATSLKKFNAQPGLKFDVKEYAYKASIGMMFTDALSSMYHSTIVRERNKGDAQRVADRYLNRLMDGILRMTKSDLLEALKCAVQEFNAIKTNPGIHPRVGIVGEIYVKYNTFANNHVAQWLTDHGLEVVLPGFFEFFDGGIISQANAVKTNVRKRDALWLLSLLGQKLAAHFLHLFDTVMQEYHYYHPRTAIKNVAAMAQEILSLNHQYGEGWLIAGEIGAFAREGVNNVLCLQPFGCIANHVIAKGVQKRLEETYPQLNLLFLDADAGVSEVNFFNRLHFFINHAKNAAGEGGEALY
jgi:predicted CoA-substrate-specific enzyme activase